jgi:hypothetical protein
LFAAAGAPSVPASGYEQVAFAQAVVACEATAIEPTVLGGRIEIVLGNGLRVIVDQQVDAGVLTHERFGQSSNGAS